jgi:hypothetical protein
MCLWKQLATRHAAGARESQEVMEGCDGWRRPLADHIRSSLSVVLTDAAPASARPGGSGLKSTTGASPEGPPSTWSVPGGSVLACIKNQVSDPIDRLCDREHPHAREQT